MSQDTLELIKSEVENNAVVLFMKGMPDQPMCGFSAAAAEILNGFNRPYKGIDVISNPEIRAKLPEFSNWPTFPQLFVKGKLVGGCDIMHEMKASGELEKLIHSAFE